MFKKILSNKSGSETNRKLTKTIVNVVLSLVTSISGIVFALLAGCPLIIVGVTGPLLLYDEVRLRG